MQNYVYFVEMWNIAHCTSMNQSEVRQTDGDKKASKTKEPLPCTGCSCYRFCCHDYLVSRSTTEK